MAILFISRILYFKIIAMKKIIALLAIFLFTHATVLNAQTHQTLADDEIILKQLLDANMNFCKGILKHPDDDTTIRKALAIGQNPKAVIVTCADSRVSPELLFDQGLGDLFVIRVAGNVINDDVLASIEYAVEHLHVGLVIVMGHESCGAVKAAVAGGEAPGHLPFLIEKITPAVKLARTQSGDITENAVKNNAKAGSVEVGEDLQKLIEDYQHKIKVVAAEYHLLSGKVEILK